MHLMRRRIRTMGSHGTESGFTLVEVLTAMALMTVLGTVVITAIISSTRVTRQDYNRQASVEQLQTTLQRVTKDIRTADPVWYGTATDLVADLARKGRCVRTEYRVSSGNLQWRRQDMGTTVNGRPSCPAYPTPAGTPITKDSGWVTLASSVTSATGFSYYTTCPASTQVVTALTTPIGPASGVTCIAVALGATQLEKRGSPTLTSSVELRNHA